MQSTLFPNAIELRAPADPAPYPAGPIDPPENPDVPVREPEPTVPGEI
jgi:hypothetical protein